MAEKQRPAKGGASASRRTASGRSKEAAKAKPARPARGATGGKPTALPAGKAAAVSEQLGPRLREELAAVEASEARILKGLADDQIARTFAHDPAAALRKMGVDVPPIMAGRLKHPDALAAVVAPRSYLLPNGQVVTARVKVRFTAGEPGRREGGER